MKRVYAIVECKNVSRGPGPEDARGIVALAWEFGLGSFDRNSFGASRPIILVVVNVPTPNTTRLLAAIDAKADCGVPYSLGPLYDLR